MHKGFAILFSFILIASGMQGFIAFSFFKLNQNAIEQTACVNKNRPKTKCHGKCYLKRKLLEQKREQEHNTKLIEQTNSLTLFPPTATLHSFNLETTVCKLNVFYLYPVSNLYYPSIDDPPKIG